MKSKISGALLGIVLAALIIFIASLSTGLFHIIINTEKCNELGYREANTKGLFDHTIVCRNPISSHQELELN